jgi:hypothetical protein
VDACIVISLDAATAITRLSKRTFWRRISSGTISRRCKDKRGRTVLALADICT